MWGAIIGDLAGSIYEYSQIKNTKELQIQKLMPKESFFSDDTILTMAILDAILNNGDYGLYLRKYANMFKDYKPNFSPYFRGVFSPGFTKWANDNKVGNSTGNGAIMRISPIGYMFNTKKDVITNVKLATIPSHNTMEAINSAITVALIIYYARLGLTKEEIKTELNLKLTYKPFTKFNVTCLETIDNCLYALFNASNFNEALTNVLSFGGDTDTNACIVGSMAEALYGIDENLILETKAEIPNEFIKLLDKGYTRVLKLKK